MSHVQPAMDRLIAALRPSYPTLPTAGVAGDEAPGDFELAGYFGFPDGPSAAARFTFDTGYVPADKTIAHELMHAGHELAAGRISPGPDGRLSGAAYVYRYDDPVLVGFHAAMRYTTALTTIIDTAAKWSEYIGEQLAEAFGYLVAGYRAGSVNMWTRWGADINARLDDGSLETFFRSLRPMEVQDLDEATTRQLILTVLSEQGYPTTVDAIKDAIARHIHDEVTVAYPLPGGATVPVPAGATGPAIVPPR